MVVMVVAGTGNGRWERENGKEGRSKAVLMPLVEGAVPAARLCLVAYLVCWCSSSSGGGEW